MKLLLGSCDPEITYDTVLKSVDNLLIKFIGQATNDLHIISRGGEDDDRMISRVESLSAPSASHRALTL